VGSKDFAHETGTKAPEGATAGASSGAVIGGALGWLAGIGSLAITGIGPFIAAGPIMGLLAGVGAGGTVGGIIGALIGMGIPEYEAKRYEGRMRKGGILLSVHSDNAQWTQKAKRTLEETGAEDISTASEGKADYAKSDKPLPRSRPPASDDHPLAITKRVPVREVMTGEVEVVDADALVSEAAERMRTWGIGFLPVREGQAILGIVTDRDIAMRAAADGFDPDETTVRAVMTSDFAYCFADDDLVEAAKTMEARHVRRLPVLDNDRRLVGILSIEDVASRAGSAELAGQVLRRVGTGTH
jgi:CBS domain-containing protein